MPVPFHVQAIGPDIRKKKMQIAAAVLDGAGFSLHAKSPGIITIIEAIANYYKLLK